MQDSKHGNETGEGGSYKKTEATGGGSKDVADDSTLTGKDEVNVTETEGKDPNEVGFDGTDDPFDPLSQPIWRKWMSVMTVSSGAICV
jgi:hypothetical protein